MGSGIRKSGALIMHRGKLKDFEGISFSKGEVVKCMDQEGNKYLETMKLDITENKGMKV